MSIIIPVNTTYTRSCIIQEGVRYCESQPVKPNEIGILLISVFALGLWIALWMWISDRYFDLSVGVAMGGGIGLPLLVVGLILLFK